MSSELKGKTVEILVSTKSAIGVKIKKGKVVDVANMGNQAFIRLDTGVIINMANIVTIDVLD